MLRLLTASRRVLTPSWLEASNEFGFEVCPFSGLESSYESLQPAIAQDISILTIEVYRSPFKLSTG